MFAFFHLAQCFQDLRTVVATMWWHLILLLGLNASYSLAHTHTTFCISTDLLTAWAFTPFGFGDEHGPLQSHTDLHVGILVFSFVCHLESERQLHPLTCTLSHAPAVHQGCAHTYKCTCTGAYRQARGQWHMTFSIVLCLFFNKNKKNK